MVRSLRQKIWRSLDRSLIEYNVGNDRQVIRRHTRLPIDEAAHDCVRGPAENTIETEDREARWKCGVTGARWKLALERLQQGARPEPFVEITEHHRHHRMLSRDRYQAVRLGASLGEAQAKMRRDYAEGSARGVDHGPDGAARFPVLMREVVNFGRAQRPAAHQHLAIITVGGNDGFCCDAMLADSLLQQLERRALAFFEATRINFLQRNNIRFVSLDRLDDAIERQLAIHADAAVDVPGHHPDRGWSAFAQA